MRETWVRFLGWEDPLEKNVYPLQCSGLENSMDYAWGLKESDTTERLSLSLVAQTVKKICLQYRRSRLHCGQLRGLKTLGALTHREDPPFPSPPPTYFMSFTSRNLMRFPQYQRKFPLFLQQEEKKKYTRAFCSQQNLPSGQPSRQSIVRA